MGVSGAMKRGTVELGVGAALTGAAWTFMSACRDSIDAADEAIVAMLVDGRRELSRRATRRPDASERAEVCTAVSGS